MDNQIDLAELLKNAMQEDMQEEQKKEPELTPEEKDAMETIDSLLTIIRQTMILMFNKGINVGYNEAKKRVNNALNLDGNEPKEEEPDLSEFEIPEGAPVEEIPIDDDEDDEMVPVDNAMEPDSKATPEEKGERIVEDSESEDDNSPSEDQEETKNEDGAKVIAPYGLEDMNNTYDDMDASSDTDNTEDAEASEDTDELRVGKLYMLEHESDDYPEEVNEDTEIILDESELPPEEEEEEAISKSITKEEEQTLYETAGVILEDEKEDAENLLMKGRHKMDEAVANQEWAPDPPEEKDENVSKPLRNIEYWNNVTEEKKKNLLFPDL